VDPDTERGLLSQVVYGLIFTRDLTDPTEAERLADAIADGRGFAAPTADLVAAIDSALANQRIHPQAVGLTPHSEADLLTFFTALRAALEPRLR
jgi:hypothetical protein